MGTITNFTGGYLIQKWQQGVNPPIKNSLWDISKAPNSVTLNNNPNYAASANSMDIKAGSSLEITFDWSGGGPDCPVGYRINGVFTQLNTAAADGTIPQNGTGVSFSVNMGDTFGFMLGLTTKDPSTPSPCGPYSFTISNFDAKAPSQSYLTYQAISQYIFVNNDSGSRADESVSIWEPSPLPSGWFFVGHVATQSDDQTLLPTGTTFLVQGQDNGIDKPCLASPTGWTQAYSFHLNIFTPQAPPGYIGIGAVGSPFGSTPSESVLNNYKCVRQDLVTKVDSSSLIQLYNDHGTGVARNITLWQLPNSGCIVASTGLDGSSPPQPVYDLKIPMSLLK